MKRAIEFEETVKITHRVVVDANSEDELDQICSLTGDSFDDILIKIAQNTQAKILESSEEYSSNTDGWVEYCDDYWTEEDHEKFPD